MSDITLSKWYQTLWLPTAAATYIIICIFDFIVMPVYVAAHNSRVEAKIFESIPNTATAAFADTLIKSGQAQRQWNPLTLLGGGMVHLAFGAILTGGTVTRGLAKKSEIEGYYQVNKSESTYRQPRGRERYNDSGPMPRTDNLD